MSITTVRGEIDAADLGATLMHEHIYSLYSDYRIDYGWDDEAAVQRAVEILKDLKASSGITAMVDLTVLGLGRNLRRTRLISELADLHVVAATGIYTFADLPHFFRNRTTMVDENWISDFLVRELTVGVGETGIRPALIKLVTDQQGANDDVKLIAQQVGRAQVRTGVPISTHSHPRTEQGLVQQELLRAEGVDLGRVIIGHSGDTTDLDYLQKIVDNGSYLGMDRFGHEPSLPLQDRIDTVVALCERGLASRMVLSHDTNVHSDGVPAEVRYTEIFSNWNFRCVPDIVLPALRERGVSESDITLMMIQNPVGILDHA